LEIPSFGQAFLLVQILPALPRQTVPCGSGDRIFAGQLANETTVSASSLIQVVTGVSQWVQISAGQNTMGGISKPN